MSWTHGCENLPGRYRVTVSSEDGEVFGSVLVTALGPERAVGIASDLVRTLGWVDDETVATCPPEEIGQVFPPAAHAGTAPGPGERK